MAWHRPLASAAAFLIAASVTSLRGAIAQEILQKAYGSAKGDYFGWSVAMGPDLDGDGFREVVVGAPFVSTTIFNGGAACVLSGRDFSRMQTLSGVIGNGQFGKSVCWCGDVDGDGLADLAVGAPNAWFGAVPTVYVYSSATWSQLRVLQGSSITFDAFGTALADAGDLNGDGVDDLLVGAPQSDANGALSGSMLVYSGSDGSLLWSIDGAAHSELGTSLAAVGDLNGDGYVDIAVGEPWHDAKYFYDRAGVVEVYSGKDQSVLKKWTGTYYWMYYSYGYVPVGDQLGIAVGAAGDFDRDGVPDVWAGSLIGIQSGGAYIDVFSGATGKTLRTMVCRDAHQTRAAAIGDADGDGLPEFISVGSTLSSQSQTFVFSSTNGRVLWELDDLGYLGISAVAGDPLSTTDFLLGRGGNDDAATDAGKVELRAANDLWLDVAPTHFPRAYSTISFTAAEGPSGHPVALFLTGVNGTPQFTLLALAPFDQNHQAPLITMTVPPGLSGTTLTVRALAIGRGGKVVDSIDELITPQ